jgi:(1->4)-alpha-D-glucan 1-alpha-D-glucosylmutase
MSPPRATVRLQLHRGFDFDAAAACVDYYARLGISHYYLSPIWAAPTTS